MDTNQKGKERDKLLQQRRKERAKQRAHQLEQLEPLRYSIPEAARILRKSVAGVYIAIKAGRLTLLKDGRRSYITPAELKRYAEAPAPAIAATCAPLGSERIPTTADAA
jgi:helix-turn-helix protein